MNLRQRSSRYCAAVLFLAGLAGVALVYAVVAADFRPSFEIGLASALVVSLILHARAGFALSRAQQEIELLRRLVDRFEPSAGRKNANAQQSDTDNPADIEILRNVKDAIENDRIELFLQPVLSIDAESMPFFEAYSSLRNRDGTVLRPNDYIHAAERANRIGVIDNMILLRSVQALRSLSEAGGNHRIFCNTSPATLYDHDFFERLTDYLHAHGDLARKIIFEFTYPATEMMHPSVETSLNSLAREGYVFSVDHVTSLDLNWKRLRDRNFRFAKAPCDVLLNEAQGGDAAFEHAQNFTQNLREHGIDLIVEKIEHKDQLEQVRRLGVNYVQGELFSAPRPAHNFVRQRAAAPASAQSRKGARAA